MKYLKISIGIFIALATSRFFPHPPNFTSLLTLSFYVPAILGVRYLPALIGSFLITDFFIGIHTVTLFTWGSIIFIGLASKFFLSSIYFRVSGSLLGALLFYIITNFGVWSLGSYGYTLEGMINCYTMAIPFFYNSVISTLIFSLLIECVIKERIFSKITR